MTSELENPSVAIPAIEELQSRLHGHAFPTGSVTIQAYEAWLGDDAMLARHPQGSSLGPMWIFLAGFRGMGLTIGELVGLAASTVTDGVLFGELGFEESIPVEVGRPYTVTGRITDITRKSGTRSGTLDILSFELEVHDGESLHGTVTSSFILPRRAS